jgi:hypothetical protein
MNIRRKQAAVWVLGKVIETLSHTTTAVCHIYSRLHFEIDRETNQRCCAKSEDGHECHLTRGHLGWHADGNLWS